MSDTVAGVARVRAVAGLVGERVGPGEVRGGRVGEQAVALEAERAVRTPSFDTSAAVSVRPPGSVSLASTPWPIGVSSVWLGAIV